MVSENYLQQRSNALLGGSGQKSIPLKLRVFVYLSHTLSSWGDRMWSFGVGLFMVIISPESLRVTAFYGLSNNIAVLLFGTLVGDWVDKTPRLKAARTTLIIQNSSVLVCSVLLYFIILYKDRLSAEAGLLELCYAGVIAIAIVSRLGSMGTSLAIQRDWIVEICGRDKDLLASVSAVMRRIDLTTKLVAPIATGQIMYFASPGIGALFIAGWNLVSVFIEYILLWKVYIQVPALRSKKKGYQPEPDPALLPEETVVAPGCEVEMEDLTDKSDTADLKTNTDTDNYPLSENQNDAENKNTDASEENKQQLKGDNSKGDSDKGDKSGCLCNCCKMMFSGPMTLKRGWTSYMKYDVAFAGLGLAMLFMTVLGFDNITVGFAYSQGVNESIMGVIMAAGSITGIIGTFLYPVFRKKIGLERTGLFGFFFEICFLCLCVASIWTPGSPFDPLFTGKNTPALLSCDANLTGSASNLTGPTVSLIGSSSNWTGLTTLTPIVSLNGSSLDPGYAVLPLNQSYNGSNEFPVNATIRPDSCGPDSHSRSYISVALLMAGIIGARCGLWMADLTVTQLFLENIREQERGIVSGTQNSLNQLMDMLKFVMVIIAPQPEVFGILILVSFAFICLGWALFAKYSHGVRGHLLHLHKCKCPDTRNNNHANGTTDIEA